VITLGKYRRTHVAHSLLYLDGNKLDFDDYPYIRPVYDLDHHEILLKTARQIGKSVSLAGLMITDALSNPHFKSLYISPSRGQTSRFSVTRLTKMITHSPLVRKALLDPALTNNVFLQIMRNGSEMALSYAWDDPDRIRGITSDRNLIDEIQDILYETTVPVVKQCMANSRYGGYTVYAGTAKSMENTIEYLWQKSTQSEWVMKCEGCGKWNYVESIKSIGNTGIVCLNCDKRLNPRTGMWRDMQPNADIKGYHVSQPILPQNNENPIRWKRILSDLKAFSETKFKNEVMGISDSIGSRMLSKEELLAMCDDTYYAVSPPQDKAMQNVLYTVGGVDWGGDGQHYVSRTVLWIFGFCRDQRLKTVYFKVFPEGVNPVEQVNEVAEVCNACNVRLIAGDAGAGPHANAYLAQALGAHRVTQMQYGGGKSCQKLVTWSPGAKRYNINRTSAIDTYMMQLKQKAVIFPATRQMAVPISDIMNVYEETTTSQGGDSSNNKRVWRHSPNASDDSLHAQVFAWMANKVVRGEVGEMYEHYEEDRIATSGDDFAE